MILVDSSVWIDYFSGLNSPESDRLDELLVHRDRDFDPFVKHLGLRSAL